MSIRKAFLNTVGIASVLLLLIGCNASAATPTPFPTQPGATATTLTHPTAPPAAVPPADEAGAEGLSDEQVATLSSLEQVDDYPLYTMHYHGAYETSVTPLEIVKRRTDSNAPSSPPAWACSLFTALANPDKRLYGRNFDWQYSPALLLFTDPPDGYASVSMVDIAYLGFRGASAMGLTQLPLTERRALLDAAFLPFDGMNEHGLAVAMAAVPPGNVHPDPDKETVGSLMVIREMLDHAREVDEAVVILRSHNIDWSGGPPLHYLIADGSGSAALVEFYQGEMVIISNETPRHQATNFLRSSVGEVAEGHCWRYDRLSHRLTETEGQMTPQGAMDLLEDVAQDSTQWSIVYEMSSGNVNVAMGQDFGQVHAFSPATWREP